MEAREGGGQGTRGRDRERIGGKGNVKMPGTASNNKFASVKDLWKGCCQDMSIFSLDLYTTLSNVLVS